MSEIDQILEQYIFEKYDYNCDFYWSNIYNTLNFIDNNGEILESFTPIQIQSIFNVNYTVIRNYIVNILDKVEY